jgi:hypothetical protein
VTDDARGLYAKFGFSEQSGTTAMGRARRD